LDRRLVAAEHGGPVKSTPNDNAPEAVSHCGSGIHVEEFYPARFRILLPNERNSTSPRQSVTQDKEQ